MKLASTIALYCGGPGSGCNPEVAQPRCGRPSETSSEAADYVASFQPIFEQAKSKFKQTVGQYGLVEGRLKTEASVKEKMQRKGRTDVRGIHDVAGLRVTTHTLSGLYAAVAALKSQFKIVEEEDKVKNPTGGVYRAYHLTAEVDGRPVEMQVRTENQSRFAIWAHDLIYKGRYKDNPEAVSYATKVSDWLYRLDLGRAGSMPLCPWLANCFSLSLPFIEHNPLVRQL